MGGACSAYGVELYTGFWWGSLGGKRPLGRPRRGCRIMLRWIFWKWGVRAWTGPSWLRIGTGGGHL